MLGRQLYHAVERENDLGVDRVLDPERAILVEGGEPVLGWHEIGTARLGRRADEIEDRSLRRAVVSGRQKFDFLCSYTGTGEPGGQRRDSQHRSS
jgi:hypothetical protein